MQPDNKTFELEKKALQHHRRAIALGVSLVFNHLKSRHHIICSKNETPLSDNLFIVCYILYNICLTFWCGGGGGLQPLLKPLLSHICSPRLCTCLTSRQGWCCGRWFYHQTTFGGCMWINVTLYLVNLVPLERNSFTCPRLFFCSCQGKIVWLTWLFKR